MTLKVVNVFKYNLPVKGLIVLLGASCMMISHSVDSSYANLNTYVISYLRQDNSDIGYNDWIFVSLGRAVTGAGMAPLGGLIAGKIGITPTLIIGCISTTGGSLLTYWALDWGFWPCVATIGISSGIGYALIYTTTLMTVTKWFGISQRGSMGGLVVAAYGFGGVIWNPLETAYVNPDNVSPVTSDDGAGKYFEDENLLKRVPNLFLILAGCYFVLQVIGILCIHDPNETQNEQILSLDSPEDREEILAALNRYSVKPKNVVKIVHFWKIYASFLSMSMLYALIQSFQKPFAQNYIHDDKFFALITTIQQFMNGFSRIIWGFIYDVMGLQFSVFVISCYCAANVFSFGNLVFLEPDSFGARFFYGFWMISLFLFLPGSFSCYPASVSKSFGAKYAASNYGIIFTAALIYMTILVVILQFGTHTSTIYIFLITGGFGVIGMVSILLFPDNVNSNDFRVRFEREEEIESKKSSVVESQEQEEEILETD